MDLPTAAPSTSEDAPEGVEPLLDINCAGGRAELAFVDLLGTMITSSGRRTDGTGVRRRAHTVDQPC